MSDSKEPRPEDEQPQIGGDPQDSGQEGEKKKKVVAPDPEKVREAEKDDGTSNKDE